MHFKRKVIVFSSSWRFLLNLSSILDENAQGHLELFIRTITQNQPGVIVVCSYIVVVESETITNLRKKYLWTHLLLGWEFICVLLMPHIIFGRSCDLPLEAGNPDKGSSDLPLETGSPDKGSPSTRTGGIQVTKSVWPDFEVTYPKGNRTLIGNANLQRNKNSEIHQNIVLRSWV